MSEINYLTVVTCTYCGESINAEDHIIKIVTEKKDETCSKCGRDNSYQKKVPFCTSECLNRWEMREKTSRLKP